MKFLTILSLNLCSVSGVHWDRVAWTGGLETCFLASPDRFSVTSSLLLGVLGPTWPSSPYPCWWALPPLAQGSNRITLAGESVREAHFLPWSFSSGGLGAPSMGRSGFHKQCLEHLEAGQSSSQPCPGLATHHTACSLTGQGCLVYPWFR